MNHVDPIAPQISLIIPVYNCERFLPYQLDALLGDAAMSMEVIAVDDGSSDGGMAIMQAYAARDARLRIIKQAHLGQGAARNAGLRVARGTWIAFADADDVLPVADLAAWHEQVISQDLDVLIGNAYRFTDTPPPAPRPPVLTRQPVARTMTGQDWIAHCVGVGEWPHYVCLQLVRRELITRHRLAFDPTIFHEDILWTADLALVAKRIGFAPEPVYGYRRNPDSTTLSASPQVRQWRGISYVHIIGTLLAVSSRQELGRRTRISIARHVLHELLCFVNLLRKDVDNPQMRAHLARAMLDLRAWPRLVRHARGVADLRRLLKAYWRLRRMARAESSVAADAAASR
ncbi:glycosyltransferase [Achromobacter sp. 2789STDY5608621]|uniref:glycosyltransferase n=1 Tax=Achromobacter sp. 2789STDY5608621 TaxID=1806496 RepID=UPI0006C11113|nr:glycosyltransferase [Achromobacter sp. 2789STDY5608621]CUJ65004.1 Chondroitin polymerase [Achromobacter sp. 2789STDY5608621]